MPDQLPLGIELKTSVDFSSYIVGRNGEAYNRLQAAQDPFIYLWGVSGCGKSHLLQATCKQQSNTGKRCAYLPLGDFSAFTPNMLDGLESMDLVCLDDLQQLAGQPDWELAAFNLFNQLREHNAQLVTSADAPPVQLPIKLRDLASRLTWGPCYQLIPLDDQGRTELLIRATKHRGLELNSETANYLLQRLPRDAHSLIQLVDRLDQASLAAQRRLTIPFVRKVLKL